jgi:hypothetical protein
LGVEISNDFLTTEENDMTRTEERKIYIVVRIMDDGRMGGFLRCRVQTGRPDGPAICPSGLKSNHKNVREARAIT